MILKGILAFAIGMVLLWVGWNNWRHRDTEAIPWIEDKILAITAEEPLLRSGFDRVSRRLQAAFGLVLGLFFSAIGLILLFKVGD